MTTSQAVVIPPWSMGDRLRKAREHAGMEQAELADRIGISRGTVSNYELDRGTRPPKVVVLRAWAAECGVPYEWVVDSAPTPGGSTPYNAGYVTSTLPEQIFVGKILVDA